MPLCDVRMSSQRVGEGNKHFLFLELPKTTSWPIILLSCLCYHAFQELLKLACLKTFNTWTRYMHLHIRDMFMCTHIHSDKCQKSTKQMNYLCFMVFVSVRLSTSKTGKHSVTYLFLILQNETNIWSVSRLNEIIELICATLTLDLHLVFIFAFCSLLNVKK